LLGGYLIARRVAKPVRALVSATEQIFEGTFKAPPLTNQHDELGLLANTFARAARLATEFQDLKRQDQQRREMVANVSHDLRTPLTSLHGYLQTIHNKADGLPKEERQRYLEVAVRQSEKIGRLAEELFEVAKLECDATLLQCEPFCLPDLIQDLLQKFMLIAQQSDVRLFVDLQAELPWAMTDISLVERVLTNLIDNAIRHTASGGEIRTSVTLEGDRLFVSVADTGAGIAPEYLPKLFDSDSLFSRFRGKRSGGLGLIIVGKILALHGSTVQVDSALAQGTRIWFDLPGHHPPRIQ
jgi:signal transduction histidine kinase